MTKQNAADAYTAEQARIDSLLNQIKAGLEKHATKAGPHASHIHWGHVGDLRHAAEVLSDLADNLNGRGEYAE